MEVDNSPVERMLALSVRCFSTRVLTVIVTVIIVTTLDYWRYFFILMTVTSEKEL